jgi:hypothetical protein
LEYSFLKFEKNGYTLCNKKLLSKISKYLSVLFLETHRKFDNSEIFKPEAILFAKNANIFLKFTISLPDKNN